MMKLFGVSTEMWVTWPYAFAKTHQTVLLKSVHFIVYYYVNLKNKELTYFKEMGKEMGKMHVQEPEKICRLSEAVINNR